MVGLDGELAERGEGGGRVRKGAGLAAGWPLVPGALGKQQLWGGRENTMPGRETSRCAVYWVVGYMGQGRTRGWVPLLE